MRLEKSLKSCTSTEEMWRNQVINSPAASGAQFFSLGRPGKCVKREAIMVEGLRTYDYFW